MRMVSELSKRHGAAPADLRVLMLIDRSPNATPQGNRKPTQDDQRIDSRSPRPARAKRSSSPPAASKRPTQRDSGSDGVRNGRRGGNTERVPVCLRRPLLWRRTCPSHRGSDEDRRIPEWTHSQRVRQPPLVKPCGSLSDRATLNSAGEEQVGRWSGSVPETRQQQVRLHL